MLAGLWGVQIDYVDIEGGRRRVNPDALAAVLAALGAPLGDGSEAALDAAVEARVAEVWRRPLEPVVVAWEGRLESLPLRLPAGAIAPVLSVCVTREDGGTEQREVAVPVGTSVPALATATDVGGIPHVVLDVPVSLELPLGYHRVAVEGLGVDGHVLVIAAPRLASGGGPGPRRLWGVFVPLYSLWSDQREASLGIGDTADLERLLVCVAAQGGDLVATLPLLPTFLDELFEPSPYSPVSRRFWNEIYIDLGSVPEIAGSPEAREALAASRRLLDQQGLLTGRSVDYRAVARAKRAVLEVAAAALPATGARRQALEDYAAQHPALESYAAFRAACEHYARPWQEWPAPARDGRLSPSEGRPEVRAYHRYVQWVAETQIARASRAGASLLFDLPLGGHPSGYDTWADRRAFVTGLSAGAPPDPLNLQGQDWGNPPLHPDRIREDGYRYTIACLRHLLAHSGVLRIDHVMGLHRVFVLPAGTSAREGTYLRYHPEELWAILCLESHRARGGRGALLVGEDLGTVPEAVREAMAEHGVSRSYLAQFGIGDDPAEGLVPVPANAFASVNTHDVATFAAWWRGLDLAQAERLGTMPADVRARADGQRSAARERLVASLSAAGLLDPAEVTESAVLDAWLAWLAASGAKAVVVTLEDLWGEAEAQNVPGTVDEHPNWRLRTALPVETICSPTGPMGRLATVHAARAASGGLGTTKGGRT